MQSSIYRLLSEFYITLWGRMDALTNEHRWVRILGEQEPTIQKTQKILDELRSIHHSQTLPVTIEQLEKDDTLCQRLIDGWSVFPEKRMYSPKDLEQMLAYLQEMGLAFGALAAGEKK